MFGCLGKNAPCCFDTAGTVPPHPHPFKVTVTAMSLKASETRRAERPSRRDSRAKPSFVGFGPGSGFEKKRGKFSQIIHFYRVFHYKPSILGYPYFWKRPYMFFSRWWFQIFFIFTPNPWGNSLQFDYIIFFFLSKGLVQPPTRKLFSNSGL